MITGALQLAAGLAPELTSFALLVLPIAAGVVVVDTTVQARAQLDTHPDMRGRVLGAVALTRSVAGALGAPVMGWLCGFAGPRLTLAGTGLAVLVASAAAGVAFAQHRGVALRAREVSATLRSAVASRRRAPQAAA